jgi:uncharacterized membrane protein YhaH (DUF805 family)
MNQEFFPHIEFSMRLVPCILAIVLVSLTRKLVGKGWLMAFAVINLVSSIGYWTVSTFMRHSQYSYSNVSKWYTVLGLIGTLGIYCLGIFLFSNYNASRLKLDINHFLFSFSGRIPRSALWIWICLTYTCGTLIGLPMYLLLAEPGNTFAYHVDFPTITYFILYACCVILSTWIALAVYAKRWHDCDKSGWMTLILFVPIVGAFWFIGYLGFVRGTDGPNQYGEDSFIV